MLVFLGVVFAVSSTLVVASVAHNEKIGLEVHGVEDGAVLRAVALRDVSISAGDPEVLDRVEVLVDDVVIDTHRDGNRLTLRHFTPTEGKHSLTARVPSTTLFVMDALVDHEFTVDNSAPVSLDAVEPGRSRVPRAVAWVPVDGPIG
jgi:hypothetical protein